MNAFYTDKKTAVPRKSQKKEIAKAALQHIARNTKIDPTDARVQQTILALSAAGFLSRPAGTVPKKEPVVTRIDPTGTMRRLQALTMHGWASSALEQRIGITQERLRIIMNGKATYVTPETADAVKSFYESLIAQSNPSEYCPEVAVSLARHSGSRRGFLLPSAWEGLDIDDPSVQPHSLVV